jgi:hypothetical protein
MTPQVLQYNAADSCARLWLKCTKFPRVGIGTQVLRPAALGLPVRMTRTGDGDERDNRGNDRHHLRRML